jgi:hypothetical protein
MRETRALAWSLAAVVTAFWFSRFTMGADELLRGTSDLRNYFYPLYELLYGWIAGGQLPSWNPYHLAGYPQIATLQAGLFYPPHLLYVVLPTQTALAVSHSAHLVLIAVSTAMLLRRLGVTSVAAALAALVFALRGAVQWWLLWPAMLEAGSWLPLGCIAVISLRDGSGLRAGCLLAFSVAMTLLAGHVQVAGYLLWAWGTLLLAMLLGRRSTEVRVAATLTRFGVALLVGAGIAAVQLLPSFELTLGGTREMGSLPVTQVLTMGAGGFRSIADAISLSQFSSGIVALALVPAALLSGRYRAFSLWAAGFGIATFALASISSEAGVELYRAIPGIGWFRSPRRIMFLSNFCVALLAGIGLDALATRSQPRSAPIAVLFAGLGLAMAAAWAGIFASATLGVGVAAAAACIWRGPTRLAMPACGALLAMCAIDLYVGGSISGRLPYTARDAAKYHADADFARMLAQELGPDRAVWLPLARSRDLKLAGAYGLRRLDDFEPLNLSRHSQYFTYFQLGKSRDPEAKSYFAGAVIPERRIRERQLEIEMRSMASRRRLLDIASVRLFVTPDETTPLNRTAADEFIAAAALSKPRSIGKFGVARNPNVVPRAFVTYRTHPAPEVDTLLARLSDPGFDPLAASYIEGEFALADGPPVGHAVSIIRDEMTIVEIDAELQAPGLLVLADAYYPGWEATVDGRPAAIYATNHLFRGVPVPVGAHRIRFEYQPVSVGAGAAVSGLSAALLVAAVYRGRRESSAVSGSLRVDAS